MLIYNADGSVKVSTCDHFFGWWLKDIIVDENVQYFQSKNERLKRIYAEIARNPYDSFEETCELKVEIKLLEPKIKLSRIKSTRNTIIVEQDKIAPFNPYVVDIISADTFKSMINFSIDLIHRDAGFLNNNLHIHENKISKAMCERPKCNKLIRHAKDIDVHARKKFCNKSCDMHSEIDIIRKCMEIQQYKVEKLIEECIKMRRDILECNYLDEIILLLRGEPNKLKSKRWPFNLANTVGENLII